MKTSYIKNFAQIYLWRGLSFLLNILSMFIVVPRISSDPNIYGVYMVCVSTAIFLAYADIGFVSAGYKYSAEAFARKDLKSEMEIQGFVSFVLAIFVSGFVIFYLTVAFRPDFLINDLSNPLETEVASKLLLIQGLFAYTVIFQRLNNAVFGIRLEDFVFQKIQMGVFSIRILSVFYFFRSDSYDIVGYFLFSKLMDLAAVLLGLVLAKFRYGYHFGKLLAAFRFSRKVFRETKDLALASFYVTIMWVLYYELDTIAIGRLLGAEAVAYFAIGITVSKLFRGLSSIIYSPFMARFNHFVGVNDGSGLKRFYLTCIKRTMPFMVFPTISIIMLIRPLILSWVGADYLMSVRIGFLLILSNLFIFVSDPTGMLITALEKIRLLYITNTVAVFIYWCGIFLTISRWHVESFAIFKLVALMITCIFYWVIAMRFLEMNLFQFMKETILTLLGPVAFLVISLFFMKYYLPLEKGLFNLLIVVATGAVFSGISIGLYYFVSKDFRGFVHESIGKFRGEGVRAITTAVPSK